MHRGERRSAKVAPEKGTILFVYASPEPWLAGALEARGFGLHLAQGRSEAIAQAAEAPPSSVIIDSLSPGAEELEMISELKAMAPDSRIVLLARLGSLWTAVEAIRRGAADYLIKPVEPDQLLAALRASKARASKEKPWLVTLERMQWEYIHMVLDFCGGNVSEAARRLGMYRQSLQRMLRRYPPPRSIHRINGMGEGAMLASYRLRAGSPKK